MAKLDSLTPKEIVDALDKYIIGQSKAKRAVAIALRNRSRRKVLDDDMRDEIMPKNIIMIGPTGVGKTEIARRLSKLAKAPFIKVEATKYTEVGYVGRDVESMIRDLTGIGINLVRKEIRIKLEKKARKMMEEALLDLLIPGGRRRNKANKDVSINTREKMREKLRAGQLEDKNVKVTLESPKVPVVEVFSNSGLEEMDAHFQNILSTMMPSKSKDQKMTVKEARDVLIEREYDLLIDMDTVALEAIKRVEEMGIVFLDEIDKIANKSSGEGPDVSREGVQRDILPLIEGSTVSTRYGMVKTDHVLFIAAGAFHMSKPSDLIPELQGRFPIRVELDSLTKDDFYRILSEPKNSLIKQYIALLETEDISLEFEDDAISKLSEIAFQVNSQTENIGARRLHTIMEKLLEDISFDAPTTRKKTFKITKAYVMKRLTDISEDRDISRYIL
ncbi:MAG TPA: ATP-dependent protease ATPase subunit HslU [Spirochaetes bacterium]|nr:ATP-dependent protease ATPase subunit HslU [Spirochaetota bacterium]